MLTLALIAIGLCLLGVLSLLTFAVLGAFIVFWLADICGHPLDRAATQLETCL